MRHSADDLCCAGEPLGDFNEAQLKKKRGLLEEHLARKRKELGELTAMAAAAEQKLHGLCRVSIRRMVLELSSGGNVRLEDGTEGNMWYSSVLELTKTRFASDDFRKFGISGVNVRRVSRVHNRHNRRSVEVRPRLCAR